MNDGGASVACPHSEPKPVLPLTASPLAVKAFTRSYGERGRSNALTVLLIVLLTVSSFRPACAPPPEASVRPFSPSHVSPLLSLPPLAPETWLTHIKTEATSARLLLSSTRTSSLLCVHPFPLSRLTLSFFPSLPSLTHRRLLAALHGQAHSALDARRRASAVPPHRRRPFSSFNRRLRC
jgi:hypothetical protein